MGFDSLQALPKIIGEGLAIAVAHHVGDTQKVLVVFRQHVGLLVGDHLDTVLDIAQETIFLRQCVACLLADPAEALQRAQHIDSAGAAQLRKTAAGDQLLRLHEELDLADTAATKLHIVTAHGDLAMALVRMDLPFDRVNIGNRGIVEIFAPDVRRKLCHEHAFPHRCRRPPAAP